MAEEPMEIDETLPSAPIIEFKRNSVEFLAVMDKLQTSKSIDSTTSSSSEKAPPDEDDVVFVDCDDTTTAETRNRRLRHKRKIRPSNETACEVIDLVDKAISRNSKCINYACPSGEELMEAPVLCLNYYRVGTSSKKRQEVCRDCFDVAMSHYEELAQQLTDGKPLTACSFPMRNDLVQIDDSESENEGEEADCALLSEDNMQFLAEHLDEVLQGVINAHDIERQIDDSLAVLKSRNSRVKESFEEINTTFNDVRKELDRIYHNVYSKFPTQYQQMPPVDISPQSTYTDHVITPRKGGMAPKGKNVSKKTPTPTPARTAAPALAPTPTPTQTPAIECVELELPPVPVNLPPKGVVVKPGLRIGETYFMVRYQALGSWIKATLCDICPVGVSINGNVFPHTMYGVMPDLRNARRIPSKRFVTGKELAYGNPATVQLEVGTRVIAVYKEAGTPDQRKDTFYPGVIAEPLSLLNKYRYLIFFDDGYAQYVNYTLVHLVYEVSKNVWEDMHADSRPFIKKYLESYPERPMVRLRKGQQVRTEYNGKWCLSTVIDIDCSLVQMSFTSTSRVEWIYRGSTRLNPMYKEEMAAAHRQLNKSRSQRPTVHTKAEPGPYVEYTRNEQLFNPDEVQPVRSVARKSTTKGPWPQLVNQASGGTVPFLPTPNPVNVQLPPPSKVVYFTPRSQTNTNTMYKPHTCSFRCKNYITYDVRKLRGYNPLSKPLLCGWNRVTYIRSKGKKEINYKAPCGRFIRNMGELHYYLRLTGSDMTVDLFDFDHWVHCLAEFVLEKNATVNKDLSCGLENVAIPVVNYVDNTVLDFCNYSTKREAMEGVNLNLDPEFLCGCDCEDDCKDKTKCSCWQLTYDNYKYIHPNTPIDKIGYQYRRLKEAVNTGIFECNSRCKCRHTCLNRVVQNPLQLKLQVFKTSNDRGWGIRCLNDIPQGAFICIYAGSILTEQMANVGGKNYGDEYLAELDYIEVVEQEKHDYEEEAPPMSDDETDRKRRNHHDVDSADEEESVRRGKWKPADDIDFVPTGVGYRKQDDYKRRLRNRKENTAHAPDPAKAEEKKTAASLSKLEHLSLNAEKTAAAEEDFVTISDDEETVREPSSFNPKEDCDLDESKPSKYPCVRHYFGEQDVYIMDAKVTGNIGRFLNHSCSPNVYVQNVFVDTHDVRFPWVSFFALQYIKAGTELTWNYNYDVGSVPGKVLYCQCSSTECRGRLL